jgi:lipopolysaccharide/colanic/teichoic acid biosynthesis glycosyltransferase
MHVAALHLSKTFPTMLYIHVNLLLEECSAMWVLFTEERFGTGAGPTTLTKFSTPHDSLDNRTVCSVLLQCTAASIETEYITIIIELSFINQ